VRIPDSSGILSHSKSDIAQTPKRSLGSPSQTPKPSNLKPQKAQQPARKSSILPENTTQYGFKIYIAMKDAIQRLLARQAGSHVAHFEEWETTYDKDGCFHAQAEDGEGNGCRMDVWRMELKSLGCAVAKRGKSLSGGDDVGEDDLDDCWS